MNQELELLQEEAERCFCDAVEAIWIQAGEHPSFKLRLNVLSREHGNWFAAKRVADVLRKRSKRVEVDYSVLCTAQCIICISIAAVTTEDNAPITHAHGN
jgi:hypothetical protein